MVYDIFISYKRKSVYMANDLYYRLTMRGYRVFFDLDEMRNDRFDEQIYNHIRIAKDMIVVLEEGSLDAIYDGSYLNDWFCKELIFALKENKNIIPLLIDGYKMPSEKDFPEEMKQISFKNALHFGGVNYFEEYINQLESKGYLTAAPIDKNKGKGIFKFFSDEDCTVFESGKQIGVIEGKSDEPFYYFVDRKGKYRFKAINDFTGDERVLTEQIDNESEEIIDISWPEREIVSPETASVDKEPLKENVVSVTLGVFSFNMIRVEGGKLRIGATDEQNDFAENDEYPAHSINLQTYYISEFPVTQNLFKLVMGYNKSEFKDAFEKASSLVKGGGFLWGCGSGPIFGTLWNNLRGDLNYDHSCKYHSPVESVTLLEAKEFCRRLSKMTNFKFSLPTEEEWEYAARGGQKTKGYIYAGSDDIDEVAWYRDNGDNQTHPVGLKAPNELGIYDMSGNVWEWTETRAHSYHNSNFDLLGEVYVRRGGSWWHEASNCRVSKRYMSHQNKRTKGLGFRIVIRDV